MGRTRRTGLAADYGGASPEDVARALHAQEPKRRSHEEKVARLLDRKLVWPDELGVFSADEVDVFDELVDAFDNVTGSGLSAEGELIGEAAGLDKP